MKKLIAITFVLCAFPINAWCAETEQLSLTIEMTTGERGRDSSSTKKTIAISGNTIAYKVTYGGRNRGRYPEQNKDFKLESSDQTHLKELIKVLNPFGIASIDRDVQVKGYSNYFALSVSQEIDGNKGTISIKGHRKRSDLKELKQYKDAEALIEAIYEIMHRTDSTIVYEPLIR